MSRWGLERELHLIGVNVATCVLAGMMVRPGRVRNSFPSQQMLSPSLSQQKVRAFLEMFFFCLFVGFFFCCFLFFPPGIGKERSGFISSCDCSLPRKQGHNSVTVTMWNYKGLHHLPRLGLLPPEIQNSVEEKNRYHRSLNHMFAFLFLLE